MKGFHNPASTAHASRADTLIYSLLEYTFSKWIFSLDKKFEHSIQDAELSSRISEWSFFRSTLRQWRRSELEAPLYSWACPVHSGPLSIHNINYHKPLNSSFTHNQFLFFPSSTSPLIFSFCSIEFLAWESVVLHIEPIVDEARRDKSSTRSVQFSEGTWKRVAKMSILEKTLPKPKIELYSGKYFAACGFGGIIGGCTQFNSCSITLTNTPASSLRTNPHRSDPPRSRENPPTSRQQTLQIQHRWLVKDLPRWRRARRLLRLVPYTRRILRAGRWKIRVLWDLQVSLWREDVPQCQ